MNTTTSPQEASPLPPAAVIQPSLQSFDEALYAIAREKGFKLNLVDHRGRRFIYRFYVDDAPAVRRFGVWAYSASGASMLVAWTKGRGRGPNGNKVRNGWGNPANAERVANLLSNAAEAWIETNGPIPTPATNKKKKRK